MEFPSTIWTVIRNAAKDPQGSRDRVVRRYRDAILGYLMKKGLTPDDAEDLAQTVFMHICKDDLLERADRAKGRFRALLLAVTENLLNMWRRKEYSERRQGTGKVLALEETTLASLADAPASRSLDEAFNRAWAANVLKNALDALQEESARAGTPYFRAAQGFFLLGWNYARIAKELGVDEGKVKNYVFRAKERLRELVRDFIKQYCGSQEEYEEELRDLKDLLFGGA